MNEVPALPDPRTATTGTRMQTPKHVPEDELTNDDDIDPESPMMASFYSEGGEGTSGRGKHVSWSRNETSRDRDHTYSYRRRQRSGSAGFTTTTTRIIEGDISTSPTDIRGRPTAPRRTTDTSVESSYEDELPGNSHQQDTTYTAEPFPVSQDELETDEMVDSTVSHSRRRRASSSASALSEATSRRTVSIVFLGAFVLFGFSNIHLNGYSTNMGLAPMSSQSTWQGNVLTPLGTSYNHENPNYPHHSHVSSHIPRNSLFKVSLVDDHTQQLIGRFAAWTCTTLYLTSRLPQIWKNVGQFTYLNNIFFANFQSPPSSILVNLLR